MIYLDYAADTPTSGEVLDVFNEVTKKYIANPNASHRLGYEAKEKLATSTGHIAQLLGIKPEEIIYTSGATEANNLAIKGAMTEYRRYGKHVITTYMEHSSVTGPFSFMQEEGYEVDYVRVKSDGQVDLEHLKELLRPDTILVSTTYVDSECGVIEPVDKISKMIHDMPHCLYHVDATQAVGKIPVDLSEIDLITMTAHKINGLHGIGMLIKKSHVMLKPLHHGGLSTTPFRSGTPSLALICSLEKALEIALEEYEARFKEVSGLNTYLKEALIGLKEVKINSPEGASPYIVNFSVTGIKAATLKGHLAEKDIFVATKSACTSPNTPSRPVFAMTGDRKRAMSMLRVSLSHLTSKEELDTFMEAFKASLEELKK